MAIRKFTKKICQNSLVLRPKERLGLGGESIDRRINWPSSCFMVRSWSMLRAEEGLNLDFRGNFGEFGTGDSVFGRFGGRSGNFGRKRFWDGFSLSIGWRLQAGKGRERARRKKDGLLVYQAC